MKSFTILLLAVAAVTALPQREPTKIVGGSTTTISQYPFSVALLASASGSGSFSQSCGGTIVTNRSVLSAAHCFVRLSGTGNWRHRVGSTNSNSGGSVFNTNQIIRHPNYNTRNEDNDFAILRISGTFSFNNNIQAGSIAGNSYNVGDNTVVWAIGWGAISQGGPSSNQLRHVQVWTVNQNTCRQRYAELGLEVTDNMLCSGWLDVGGRDQCQGDSGGPLLHNNIVIGVCSWGAGCAQARYPGVNARVSRASSWIFNNA